MNDFDFEPLPADVIDLASRQEQATLAAQIAAASRIVKRQPVNPGKCDWCGDPTDTADHLFCSADCREGDALERKMRAISGRIT